MGRIALISVVSIVLIIINIFLLNQTEGVTILFLVISDAVIISLMVLFFPFTVRYKEISKKYRKQDSEEVKKKSKADLQQ